METKTFLSEIPRFRRTFPCFVKGCKKAGKYLTRLNHGKAVVQVCLCGDCLKKSSESILRGLGTQTDTVFN